MDNKNPIHTSSYCAVQTPWVEGQKLLDGKYCLIFLFLIARLCSYPVYIYKNSTPFRYINDIFTICSKANRHKHFLINIFFYSEAIPIYFYF